MDAHQLRSALCPRVYVVSDVRLHREGLIGDLASNVHLNVVGAGSAAAASFDIEAKRPDVVLLDIQAEGSFSLPEKLKAHIPALRIVGYAVGEIESGILACARAGMCGFVGRDADVSELVEAVIRAVNGELVCSPKIAALLFGKLAADPSASAHDPDDVPLTLREKEIAGLVAEGLANKEIARKLKLGIPTVKNHVHHILCKLKVARRTQIAALFGRRSRAGPILAQDELSEKAVD
jgi:two-component system nitrate/nitrite response regulator NarL